MAGIGEASDGSFYKIPKVAVLISLIIVAQMFVFFLHPANPLTVENGIGWFGWWDQSKYLDSAVALAEADFSTERHWYPLGYSILAAPFTWLAPKAPFIFVNVAALSLYGLAFFKLFRPYIGLYLAFAALVIGLLFPLSLDYEANRTIVPVLQQFTIPWNSTIVAAIYLWVLVLVRDMLTSLNWKQDMLLGALVAMVLVTRPVDLLPLFVPGIAYLIVRIRQPNIVRHVGSAVCGGALVLSFVLILMLLIYGGVSTPYMRVGNTIGFGMNNLLERAYAIFIDASSSWAETPSIFKMQPWLYIAVPCAFVWAILRLRDALMIMMTVTVSIIVYLAYNDFAPINVFRFQLMHYITWALPVILAAGLSGLVLLYSERRWRLLIMTAVFVPAAMASYRIVPTSVPTSSVTVASVAAGEKLFVIELEERADIDALDFIGARHSSWMLLTSKRFKFSVDGESLAKFKDYRVIPYKGGIRVIFNRNIQGKRLEFVASEPIILENVDADDVIVTKFRGTINPLFWQRRLILPIPSNESSLD